MRITKAPAGPGDWQTRQVRLDGNHASSGRATADSQAAQAPEFGRVESNPALEGRQRLSTRLRAQTRTRRVGNMESPIRVPSGCGSVLRFTRTRHHRNGKTADRIGDSKFVSAPDSGNHSAARRSHRSNGRIQLVVGALLAALWFPGACRADVLSHKSEIELGKEAASQVEKMMVVDDDPVAVARVRGVGRRLVAASEDKSLPFEFHVVDANDVNAFALPGGYVYVYRGLLQLLPNDDALGFVMGHEMTHAIRHHGLRQWEKNMTLSIALTAALGGNALAAQQLVQILAGLKFSRDDEAEADRRGIALMARAGYDPDQAAESMLVIKHSSDGKDDTPTLLRDHPATEDRIKTLRALAVDWKSKQPIAPAPGPATAVALADPAFRERTLPGLEGVALAPCAYFPLKVGANWHYRVTGPAGVSTVTVTVVESLATNPSGVYRLERDLGRGVVVSQIVAPQRDSILISTPGGAEWRRAARFTAAAAGIGEPRLARMETVHVPAGTYEAARVEQFDRDGKATAICWYAGGVGLIRRQSLTTGLVEELERCWIP